MILSFFTWVLLIPAHRSSAMSNHQHQQQMQSPQKNIFILAGQSNMAGRGGIVTTAKGATQIWDGVVPPACEPDPSILRLDARLAWAEAREPLHEGIDVAGSVDGVGPGMAFARAVLAKDRSGLAPVGLVPCAMGGTNISHWEKGSALYRRMVSRTRAAVRGEGGGTIRALLWYQGESDTIVKQDAEAYGRRLEKLFGDIRMDLMSPLLPIIQVQYRTPLDLIRLFITIRANYVLIYCLITSMSGACFRPAQLWCK